MSTVSSDTLNKLETPEVVILVEFNSRECMQQLCGAAQSSVAAILKETRAAPVTVRSDLFVLLRPRQMNPAVREWSSVSFATGRREEQYEASQQPTNLLPEQAQNRGLCGIMHV